MRTLYDSSFQIRNLTYKILFSKNVDIKAAKNHYSNVFPLSKERFSVGKLFLTLLQDYK